MAEPLRLSPEMASRKLQVLAAVKRYWANYGDSPSFAEIAAECDIDRTTAWRICQVLDGEGKLVIGPGRRNIGLPDPVERITLDDALNRLRAAGYVIDDDWRGR